MAHGCWRISKLDAPGLIDPLLKSHTDQLPCYTGLILAVIVHHRTD
jgi:hypothetical protein